jgi:hypothetical protein
MLWYRGETLIQEVFQTKVVHLDQKGMTPTIRMLVLDCLNEADQLPFVSYQLGVLWRKRPTKEHWSLDTKLSQADGLRR